MKMTKTTSTKHQSIESFTLELTANRKKSRNHGFAVYVTVDDVPQAF